MKKTKLSRDKKRHGLHHRHGKSYARVYLPYLPAVLMLITALLLSNLRLGAQSATLAYATNMSRASLTQATNRERDKAGKDDLRLDDQLNAAAQAKAKDMATRNYWSHNTPDGKEPWVFVDQTGYAYLKAGENLAYGFLDSNSTIAGWMNSQSHRENMLDPSFVDVGFGFANAAEFQNSGPQTIVVAMYGKPTAQTAAAPAEPFAASGTSDGLTSGSRTDESSRPSQHIARVQALTGGRAPWAMFAVGTIAGLTAATMLANHGLRFRRLVRQGEYFLSHHPVFDVTLVSLLVLALVLSQSVGVIK